MQASAKEGPRRPKLRRPKIENVEAAEAEKAAAISMGNDVTKSNLSPSPSPGRLHYLPELPLRLNMLTYMKIQTEHYRTLAHWIWIPRMSFQTYDVHRSAQKKLQNAKKLAKYLDKIDVRITQA